MNKKLYLIFIIVSFLSCQNNDEKLIGHWHEFKVNNSEYLDCYHITDSSIGINPLIDGGYEYYFGDLNLKKSKLMTLTNQNYKWNSDYKIIENKIKLNDSIFWVKQTDERASFLKDFSAGLLVNINPPESTNSEFDYKSHEKSIEHFIFIGKIKKYLLDNYNIFNKDEYYIQLNDKIGYLNDIVPFLMCSHCDFSDYTILMHVDKNTPRTFLTEIESEMFKIGIAKNQIYYLTVDTNKLTKGYNHSY